LEEHPKKKKKRGAEHSLEKTLKEQRSGRQGGTQPKEFRNIKMRTNNTSAQESSMPVEKCSNGDHPLGRQNSITERPITATDGKIKVRWRLPKERTSRYSTYFTSARN